jgi:acetyl-CoA acyltransferase
MRKVAVIGVGMTHFGKFLDTPIKELGRRATWDAIKDAGISPKDIQIAYVGNACLGIITGQAMVLGQIILKEVGVRGIPITNVENACASGSSAFREAWMAVASGMYDIALAVGAEKLYAGDTRLSTKALAGGTEVEYEANLGLTMPGHWALRAKRYMEKYGTTKEQLAKVSVKNHHNGCLNPRSQYKKECTVEEVLNSRMIADPLTVLSCNPLGDGAAAAVLASAKVAAKFTTRPIWVAASALTSGSYDLQREISRNQLEEVAGKQAFEMAGIGPQDLDLAEVHDCFTIAEFMRVEGLGLVPEGEYGKWLDEGWSEIGGKLAVNPSGGLLAKGHPVGATGVAQVAEVVWHLRGEAGERQVQGAKAGLAHCSGGGVASDTPACCVHILKR